MAFSAKLLAHPEAKNADALRRIELAKNRIQSVLDRERVATQKTLEQKISDQGPKGMRVDPHLLGLAVMDLRELSQLKEATHPSTGSQTWLANRLTKSEEIQGRLADLAPLYASTLRLSNMIGDALEIVTEKAIATAFEGKPRFTYQGHFLLDEPRDKHGRYKKIQPPKSIGSHSTLKEADFLLFGFDSGPVCVECKNYREWFYPIHGEIRATIVKAYELGAIPLLVARRIHYTARENLFGPCGIAFHESFYQYYDPDNADIAAKAREKTLLGFSDIRPSHDPDKRTLQFFDEYLPRVLEDAAPRWEAMCGYAYAYAKGEMNLAQLYTEIGSRAGGKWINPVEDQPA